MALLDLYQSVVPQQLLSTEDQSHPAKPWFLQTADQHHHKDLEQHLSKDNFPFMTPARQLLSISNLKKGRSLSPEKLDTGRTARTMTPGGTQFSPLKTEQFSPLPIRRLHEIPAASFSPPKTRSTTKSKRRHRSPSIPFRQPVRHLLEYDPNPRQVDDYYPQPVLTLRHCLDTTALSDVFAWAKQCATAGKIIPLKECLINFRDWSRVHDLHEAAIVLGLKILQTQCELVLEEWETEFDDWQTYPVDRTASQDLQRRHQERSKNMVNGAFLKYASEQIVETMPLPEPPISEDVAMKDETDSDIPLASIVSEQATDAVRGGSRGGGRGGRGNRGGRGCGRGTGTGKRGRRGRTPKVT